jgi:hypothetical protein
MDLAQGLGRRLEDLIVEIIKGLPTDNPGP